MNARSQSEVILPDIVKDGLQNRFASSRLQFLK
jgi:hypothetical protein